MTRNIQRIVFEGHVQGVGFRYCAREISKGFEVTGTIKNLPTGNVEMIVCGLVSEITEFVSGIQQSEVAKHIRNTVITPTDENLNTLKGFRIVN